MKKDKRIFASPFRMMSPKLDSEALKLQELYRQPFSESFSVEKGVLVTISKIIEMTQLMAKYVLSGSADQFNECANLAKEVHDQERVLTRQILDSGVKGAVLKSLLRFPYRLERVGDLQEGILSVLQAKAAQGVPFNDRAHSELDELFNLLADTLNNLRDAFIAPNKVLLDHVLDQARKMSQLLDDFRLAHWERVEGGFCHVQATSMYLHILDAFKATNEYIVKMAETLLTLGSSEELQEDVA
jgi:Na+/phosphate symporter